MKEENLKKYFENLLTAQELSNDLESSNIENGEFEIYRFHLIKICEDFINRKFSAFDITTIALALSFSDFFTWNGNSDDGKLIGEIVFDWSNPELGFDLTIDNFVHWKEYLETGSTKYLTKEELKKKFRGVKKNGLKRNGI
ncbi:hypothetical protein G4D82_12170 [Flavobacterium sp. CYK-4]|uniref:hypothetical protein n=1 Tax=Flavobacterium lotistagni TaxID=2709660 RepID=UPI00140AB145|nr:hypothetical protein [Flavobacterium lotistagni]NHM07981.1 hypothetical protein [Flavobacterium lotistagni]